MGRTHGPPGRRAHGARLRSPVFREIHSHPTMIPLPQLRCDYCDSFEILPADTLPCLPASLPQLPQLMPAVSLVTWAPRSVREAREEEKQSEGLVGLSSPLSPVLPPRPGLLQPLSRPL